MNMFFLEVVMLKTILTHSLHIIYIYYYWVYKIMQWFLVSYRNQNSHRLGYGLIFSNKTIGLQGVFISIALAKLSA